MHGKVIFRTDNRCTIMGNCNAADWDGKAMPRPPSRSQQLLEPMADPSGSATGRFAAFLATQVAERQRIAREIERLNKERVASERERQAADKERDKREEALRQQLEALRAIERGILDREERLRRSPGAKP